MARRSLIPLAVLLLAFSAAPAQEQAEPTTASAITGANLPWGAVRFIPSGVPREIYDGLDKLVAAGNGKVVAGRREVLAWTGSDYHKANAPQILRELQKDLATEGWAYKDGGRKGDFSVFSVTRKKDDASRAISGLFDNDRPGSRSRLDGSFTR